MIHLDDETKPRTAAGLFKVVAVLLIVAIVSFFFQYESIKDAIRVRIFAITSEHVVRREEIKEITNQAVSQIETTKQDSLDVLDNKAKEITALNEAEANQAVVSDDVLKAINKARKETR